tara:strand:- start:92750 stop:93211 length:462 start_codon:yes stop_codon:yes gene_type:complete
MSTERVLSNNTAFALVIMGLLAMQGVVYLGVGVIVWMLILALMRDSTLAMRYQARETLYLVATFLLYKVLLIFTLVMNVGELTETNIQAQGEIANPFVLFLFIALLMVLLGELVLLFVAAYKVWKHGKVYHFPFVPRFKNFPHKAENYEKFSS